MGKKVTVGGDRVGSGKKMQAELHNYFRSTHNLSQACATSMGAGILYPTLCIPAMRGDSFDINVSEDCRTIPTKGPLFGKFIMQTHIYQVPVRLYQGILHNNPFAVGLKMSQIKFPKITITENADDRETYGRKGKMNNTSLLKYLGLSGIGETTSDNQAGFIKRDVSAIPALAYYDILKNYYANKQEEKAYVISAISDATEIGCYATKWYFMPDVVNNPTAIQTKNWSTHYGQIANVDERTIKIIIPELRHWLQWYANNEYNQEDFFKIEFSRWDGENYLGFGTVDLRILYFVNPEQYNISGSLYDITYTTENAEGTEQGIRGVVTIKLKPDTTYTKVQAIMTPKIPQFQANIYRTEPVQLMDFPLQNIDDMRYDLLSSNELGTTYKITANTQMPYKVLAAQGSRDESMNQYPLNGLALRTYQNDIFNNWLNTEWIEGENGISALSSVQVVDGKFSMDALSFAEKQYNLLNRVAISGNTYEDWQDVVYETVKRRQIESPVFCGGASRILIFDEIVQSTPTQFGGGDQPLGTLGGRGRFKEGQNGGKIHIKCDEACFIIGITSLVPEIYYTQGNEFYMTELDSMDDFHKPAWDGIGFQDLIGERLAWWDTKLNSSGIIQHRSKIGKLPAWIEYMTAVNKAYGDFAGEEGTGYMILNRNYERDEETGGIADATTYVDPSKYNYVFAVSDLTAQNFWAEIYYDIKARRLMSARLIPHV